MEKILLQPWKNWLFVNLFGCSLLSNIFVWVWLNWKISPLAGTEIPLHYSVEFGLDVWGEPQRLFVLPAMGLAIFLLNTVLAFFLWPRARVLALVLESVALVCQLILLAVSILILTV